MILSDFLINTIARVACQDPCRSIPYPDTPSGAVLEFVMLDTVRGNDSLAQYLQTVTDTLVDAGIEYKWDAAVTALTLVTCANTKPI